MSREKGNKLEKKIEKRLKDIGVKRTAKSGGHWDNADLRGPGFIIEAKYKDIPNLRTPKKEIENVQRQAKKLGLDWVYIQENQSGTYAVVDAEWLFMMMDYLSSFVEKQQ
jgi:hypothetical protein